MKYYEVTRHIDAPPQRVWEILTDAERLTTKDFGITKLEGDLRLGGKIKLWSLASPERAFSLKVSRWDKAATMVWEGGMPLGMFKGVRTFTLTPNGTGTTFCMREEFTGFMLGMIWKSMPDLNPSFKQFADALEREATS